MNSIITTFEEDSGMQWGRHGEPQQRLRELTDPIWGDYCYRRGYGTAEPASDGRWLWVCKPQPGREDYTVTLMDGTPLDLDKTLAENGLTERSTRVRFSAVCW